MKARQTGGGGFTPLPEGVHTGVITGLVDLGKQQGIQRPGLTIKDAYKIALIVTFPDFKLDSGEAMTVTKTETASMYSRSNLRQFIEALFGKAFPSQEAADDFDFEKLLGRPGLFSVIHKTQGDKTYANIKTAMALPANMPKPQVDPSTFIKFDGTLPEPERSAALAKVPEWLQKKWHARMPDEPVGDGAAGSEPAGEQFDDDIPF